MTIATVKAADGLIKSIRETDRITILPEPFDFSRLETFPVEAQHPGMKPKGFWWGVGPSWIQWAQSDMPSWLHPYVYHVEIDRPRVLLLDTPAAILQFTEDYLARDCPVPGTNWSIRWADLIQRGYAGIEIAPYQWSLRLDHRVFWYYGWDCASGVAWDKTCLLSVRPFMEYDPGRDEYVSVSSGPSPRAIPRIEDPGRKVNWQDG